MNIVTVITRTAGGEIKKVPGRINFDDIESMSANTYDEGEKKDIEAILITGPCYSLVIEKDKNYLELLKHLRTLPRVEGKAILEYHDETTEDY